MNWGKGIVIGMSLFIVFILVLVIGLMSHRVDLQSEDYYQKEINYESELQAMRNSSELENKIEVIEQKEYIVIQIPSEGEYIDLKVEFIRPDDNKLDQSFKIVNTKSYLIERKSLIKGKYNLEIYYSHKGKDCLQKQNIYI
jgi:hypothetical protein